MHTRPNSRGFTLIELLTSIAIGTIVLLLAATSLRTSLSGYERTSSGIGTEREARAAIGQLAADLNSAVWHKDAPITKSTAAWPTDSIGFLSIQPDQAQSENGRIGDLCAIYFYTTDLQINNHTVRCLMRGFRESQETFQAIKQGTTASLFAPRADIDEPIAFGVVSLQARPKALNANGTLTDWQPGSDTPPHTIETRLVLARRTLMNQLKDSAAWDGSGPTAKLLGQAADAEKNPQLVIYTTPLPYGSHEKP